MAQRDDLTKEIELRLGGQMVDVELDPEHYELSINKSFEKYRQRSENSVEESFIIFSQTFSPRLKTTNFSHTSKISGIL